MHPCPSSSSLPTAAAASPAEPGVQLDVGNGGSNGMAGFDNAASEAVGRETDVELDPGAGPEAQAVRTDTTPANTAQHARRIDRIGMLDTSYEPDASGGSFVAPRAADLADRTTAAWIREQPTTRHQSNDRNADDAVPMASPAMTVLPQHGTPRPASAVATYTSAGSQFTSERDPTQGDQPTTRRQKCPAGRSITGRESGCAAVAIPG